MTDCWSIILHCCGVKRPNFFLSSPFAWVYDCILMIWVILIEMGFTTRVQRETHLCILSCKYLFHILPAKKNHLNAIIQISSLICTTTRRKYRIVCGEFGQGVAQLNDKTKEFNCRLCWWLIGHKPIKEVWLAVDDVRDTPVESVRTLPTRKWKLSSFLMLEWILCLEASSPGTFPSLQKL